MTLLVVLSLVASAGVVSAESQSLAVSVDSPADVTAGERTSVNASVTTPDVPLGSYSNSLTVELFVDGEQVSEETLTVSDGETTAVDFEHTFATAGSHDVEVRGSVTLAGQTYSSGVTETIDVSADSTMTGAAFTLPSALEDDVDELRQLPAIGPGLDAFVLAAENRSFVVFTDATPEKGRARVTGTVLSRNVSFENLSLGVIAASNVSFDQTGNRTTVRNVAENPDAHRLDLVRISATHRRVSTLTDPDQDPDVALPVTSGVLVEDPTEAAELFDDLGGTAGDLSQNVSLDRRGASPEREIERLVRTPSKPYLHTVSFETEFWADGNATVDAVVLSPGSAAREYVAAVDDASVVATGSGTPLLYVVEESFDAKRMDSVADVKANASELDGAVVSLRANVSQTRVSVQETVEETTGCSPDVLLVPTPNGPVCVDVPQDVLLHGGAAWTSLPDSRQDVLLLAGASSREQDAPLGSQSGEYRLVGEVVHTSRISESLPNGSLLVVYDAERQRSLDREAMGSDAKQRVSERQDELRSALRSDLNSTYVNGSERNATNAPVAAFEYAPGSPAVNETVTFDASDSTVPDGDVQSYAWDFDGDGRTDASGATATHTFASAGEHEVALTVTGTAGSTNSTSQNVTVVQADASPVDVVAGSDGEPSLREVQRGIQLWSSGEAVPEVGERLSISEVQSLIQAWANDEVVGS